MLICWLRNYEIKTTRLAADPADAEDAGAALESQAVDDAAADPESPAAETSAPRPAASMTDVLALQQGLASAAENRDGYELALFKHWVDADGGGCDTRKEVLIAEAVQPTGRGAGCRLSGANGSRPTTTITRTTRAVSTSIIRCRWRRRGTPGHRSGIRPA